MKTTRFSTITITAAALAFAALPAAQAQAPTERFQGTWECYGPGQTAGTTPPILHLGAGEVAGTLAVDGFARTVYGAGTLTEQGDGRVRVTTPEGVLVLSALRESGKQVSMNVARDGGGSYRCNRLPKYVTPMIPREREVK
jgi:hypothetical protein